MKSLMILEGGSYRGIYTSGVLDVFMEHGIYTDCVVGISAGALNGMGYMAQQVGRCRDIVLSYGMDPRYVGTKAIRKEHNLVGFDFILRDMQKVLPFDEETFLDPEREFYAVVTNCQTGKAEFISRDGEINYLDAVAASSSMPFLCKKVQLGDQLYLDGGIASRLGLDFIEEHPEYERIVVILTRGLSYRKKKPSKLVGNLARRLYHDYPALQECLRNEDIMYAAERERLDLLQKAGRVQIVAPEAELDIGRLERDPEKLKLGYEIGVRDGERAWERIKAYLSEKNGTFSD